jgi:hypothetical protein
MISRSGTDAIGLREFLTTGEKKTALLTEQSSKELFTATMDVELERIKGIMRSTAFAAEEILHTGIVSDLIMNSIYFEPPIPQTLSRLRPPDEYYRRFASKDLLEHPGFRMDLIVPNGEQSAAIEIQAEFFTTRLTQCTPQLELSFEVNYDQTLVVFNWLLKEWRRPIGQLLRAIPDLELWENGTTIESLIGCRTKDPANRLEAFLVKPVENTQGDKLFSLRRSFSLDHTDQDLIVTFATFLALFDAVYRLTTARADPDRILKHYQILENLLPRAPFRLAAIFPKE